MKPSLSHTDASGAARMVDVGDKSPTRRRALAEGMIELSNETLSLIYEGHNPKGDTLAVARIAGIMAAKRTPDLIPLCHALPITGINVDFIRKNSALQVIAEVKCDGKTGVEMEALAAVSATLLTVYDMVKAVEKSAVITGIRLLEKDGGKSGPFRAGDSQ